MSVHYRDLLNESLVDVSEGYFDNITVTDLTVDNDLTVSNDLIIENNLCVTGEIQVDTIVEKTTDNGVTIDSVLLKDNEVSANAFNLLDQFNTKYGYLAGDNLASSDCVLIGMMSGANMTTGNSTVSIGSHCLENGNPSSSVFIGKDCGRNVTTASGVFIGAECGESITDANFCTMIGFRSGWLSSGACTANTFYGYICGQNVDGNSNCYYGSGCGYRNQLGSANCAYGTNCFSGAMVSGASNCCAYGDDCLLSSVDVSGLCAYGKDCCKASTSATQLCGFGYGCMDSLTTGNRNHCFSYTGFTRLVTGHDNTGFGYLVGQYIVSTSSSCFYGARSGQGSTTDGSRLTLIGASTDTAQSINDAIGLGYLAIPQNTYDCQIGERTQKTSGQLIYRLQVISDQAWDSQPASYGRIDGSGNMTRGDQDLETTSDVDFNSVTSNSFILEDPNNVFLGINAGDNVSGSIHCVGIGRQCLMNLSTGLRNTFCGNECGRLLESGSSSSGYGDDCLAFNVSGSLNSAYGHEALRVYLGSNGCAFGARALMWHTGTNCSAFGYQCLQNMLGGARSSAMGCNSLRVCTASDATSMGNESGLAHSTGLRPCYYGSSAGRRVTIGDDLCLMGYASGDFITSSIQCTFLGSRSGSTIVTTESGLTLIGNQTNIASAGIEQAIALGNVATVQADYDCQIGQRTQQTSGKMYYRLQQISDQAWSGQSDSYARIDSSGNITRGSQDLETTSNVTFAQLTLDNGTQNCTLLTNGSGVLEIDCGVSASSYIGDSLTSKTDVNLVLTGGTTLNIVQVNNDLQVDNDLVVTNISTFNGNVTVDTSSLTILPTGTAAGAVAATDADDLIISANVSAMGMSFITDSAISQSIRFSRSTVGIDFGWIRYDHSANEMFFKVDNVEEIVFNSGGIQADSFDSYSAGVLQLGHNNATRIELGDVGVLTIADGSFEVTSTSLFNDDVTVDTSSVTILPTGTASGGAPLASADDFIITGDTGDMGMSFITDSAISQRIVFSYDDSVTLNQGSIRYDHSSAEMYIRVDGDEEIMFGGNSNFSADTIDAFNPTTLTLGPSTATKVEIADTSVTTEIQGPLTCLDDVTLPNGASAFNWYEEHTESITFQGAFSKTSNIQFVRVGNNVTMMFDAIQASVTSNDSVNNGGDAFPSQFRPGLNINFTVWCTSGGTLGIASRLNVSATGVMTFFNAYDTGFGVGSTGGPYSGAVSWSV